MPPNDPFRAAGRRNSTAQQPAQTAESAQHSAVRRALRFQHDLTAIRREEYLAAQSLLDSAEKGYQNVRNRIAVKEEGLRVTKSIAVQQERQVAVCMERLAVAKENWEKAEAEYQEALEQMEKSKAS